MPISLTFQGQTAEELGHLVATYARATGAGAVQPAQASASNGSTVVPMPPARIGIVPQAPAPASASVPAPATARVSPPRPRGRPRKNPVVTPSAASLPGPYEAEPNEEAEDEFENEGEDTGDEPEFEDTEDGIEELEMAQTPAPTPAPKTVSAPEPEPDIPTLEALKEGITTAVRLAQKNQGPRMILDLLPSFKKSTGLDYISNAKEQHRRALFDLMIQAEIAVGIASLAETQV
jgi:hypothetical protein